jgi:hypothetical protein
MVAPFLAGWPGQCDNRYALPKDELTWETNSFVPRIPQLSAAFIQILWIQTLYIQSGNVPQRSGSTNSEEFQSETSTQGGVHCSRTILSEKKRER